MPFVDFDRLPSETMPARPEILVVGAGAAGIFLATRLAAAGRRVLLVESGHFSECDERQALNRIEETGKRQGNPIWNRKRMLGGTTTAWGGQSLPFTPIDFERRPWVGDAAWPVGFEELAPHYAKANEFMGVDSWNYRDDIEKRLRISPRPGAGFDRRKIDLHFSKWAPQPNFLKAGRRRLERDVTVLYNAHLVRLNRRAKDGAVASVELAGFNGRRLTLEADVVLLATGAIEACRTLLLAERESPGGMGNHSGWLGRGYMDHPCLTAGEVDASDDRRLQRLFGGQRIGIRRYSVRISASDAWQRERRLLNSSASLMFAYDSARDDWLAALGNAARRPSPGNLSALWRLRRESCSGLVALIGGRFVYRPGAKALLCLMTEQEPTPESRIDLSEDPDRFGLPRARLHWRVSEKTWLAKRAFATVVKEEIERLGLGRVTLIDPILSGADNWEELLCDVNHHMGGTRMGARPEDGVVDADLRVWGVPNLYVCSSSVFPTSSHSNPTLTLLALCSRWVDRNGRKSTPSRPEPWAAHAALTAPPPA